MHSESLRGRHDFWVRQHSSCQCRSMLLCTLLTLNTFYLAFPFTMHLHLFCAGPNSPLKNTSQIKRLQRQILKYLKNSSRSLLVRTGGSCVILSGCYVKDNTKRDTVLWLVVRRVIFLDNFGLRLMKWNHKKKIKTILKDCCYLLLFRLPCTHVLYRLILNVYFENILMGYF